MARKKQQPKRESAVKMQGFIAGAGEIVEQDINDTIRKNFMPYAMSVILSRAIPEIDGFKPSHRKLLYTMYKMNLLGSARTKSANIVGQTMKLNPHGDAAIYETMAVSYTHLSEKGIRHDAQEGSRSRSDREGGHRRPAR